LAEEGSDKMKVMKGQIVDGYIFQGGDVGNEKNWKPVNPSMMDSMKEELASRSGWDKFWGGTGARTEAVVTGAKGALLPKGFYTGPAAEKARELTPNQKERLELGKLTRQTTPGMLGGAAADIAMTYPLYGLLAAKTAGMGPAARDLTQIGGAGAIGAATGAVANPDNRLAGAMREGVGAATGMTLGVAARGLTAPGVGSTADAFQAQGVRLTPGQSAGGILKSMEDANRVINPSVGKRQTEAMGDWNKNNLQSVSSQPITAPGHVGNKEAKAAFSQEYTQAGNAPMYSDLRFLQDTGNLSRNVIPNMTDDAAKAYQEQLTLAHNLFSQNKNVAAVRQMEQDLNGLALTASESSQSQLAHAYKQLAKHLEELRGRQGAATPDLDARYAKFSRMKEASAMKGAMDDGVYSPTQLKTPIQGKGSTEQLAMGEALLQPEAAKAAQVLGPTIPPVGPGTAEKLLLGGVPGGALIAYGMTTGDWSPLAGAAALYAGNRAAYTPLGVNLMSGNNPIQRAIGPAWQAALAAGGGALADPVLSRKRQ
jgi:hypothetical protein